MAQGFRACLQRPNSLCKGKRREGPAYAARHIRAPREHQVFITRIPMKQLQGNKPHTGGGRKTTVTHTDLGLSPSAVGPGAGKAQTRLELSLAAQGSREVGSCPLQGSQARPGASMVPHPHPHCTRFQTWLLPARAALPSPGKLGQPAGVEAIEVPFPLRSHFLPAPITQASNRSHPQSHPAPAQASWLSLKVSAVPGHGTAALGCRLRPLGNGWCRLRVPRI